MNHYLIKTKHGDIELKYDSGGSLYFVDCQQHNAGQRRAIFDKVPLLVKDRKELLQFARLGKGRLVEVEPDLSFQNFWDTYGYKVGKKKMAENKWARLPKKEKIKALDYIEQYRQHLRLHPNLEQAYPTTYLNQEYWNNE